MGARIRQRIMQLRDKALTLLTLAGIDVVGPVSAAPSPPPVEVAAFSPPGFDTSKARELARTDTRVSARGSTAFN